jgi:hypothetical protein
VLGIRTTIPFFTWLMRQPEYQEGRYDTTWLDRLMVARRGESFNELDDAESVLVTIGAAIYASMTARAARPGGSTDSVASAWQRAARLDALRS